MTIPAFVQLLMISTTITMFVSGVWHGAGYTFVIYGLMHGTYLTINHAWRQIRPRVFSAARSRGRISTVADWALTFLAVVFAIVMFRAPSVHGAVAVWGDMLGGHGVTLPEGLLARLGSAGQWLHAIGVRPDASSGAMLTEATLRITVLLLIVLCMPNSLEMLARYEPALGVKPAKQENWLLRRLRWTGSGSWAVGIATVAAAGILSLGQLSEFLYWQF